jgi:hypothetical protein
MFSMDLTVKTQTPPADVAEAPVRDLAEVLSEVRADARALAGDYLAETEVPHGGE